MVNEFAGAIRLPKKVEKEFPAPGSNRGIDPSAYVRTLIYQFSEGGRHIEDTRQIKADEGFRSLIDLDRMPGPDGNRGHVSTPWAIGFGGWEAKMWKAKMGKRRFGVAMTCW